MKPEPRRRPLACALPDAGDMTPSRPNVAQPLVAILLLTSACSASHEVAAVGAAGEASCVAYWLAADYGSSIVAYGNTTAGPSEPIEIPISDPMGGDQRFTIVTTVDVDGDGLRDAVVRDAYGGAALLEERVSLTIIGGSDAPLEERERTRFIGETSVGAGGGISALGDWNGDGLADLSAQYAGGVLLSGESLTESPDSCLRGTRAGDVDGDGTEDTICMSSDGPGLSLRFGGDASPDSREFALAADPSHVAAMGDVDGDGRPELLVGNSRLLHLVDGTFTDLRVDIRSVKALGDIDGDGIDDLVARRDDAYYLWRGGSSGPTEDAVPFAVVGEEELSTSSAGDANCDGYADVIVRRAISGGPDEFELRLGSPDGLSADAAWRRTLPDQRLTPVFD